LFERLDFLGFLLLELADLTLQLFSLLVVRNLELLQNVFVELSNMFYFFHISTLVT